MQRRAVPIREAHSEIESLAAEHRQRVFWLVKEARKSHAEAVRRLLALVIADGILLSGLALVLADIKSGLGFSGLPSPMVFAVGAAAAGFFLAVSLILALYGAAFISPPVPALTISGELLPRQQVLNQAQADLARIWDMERRASAALRGAALFLLVALLPYLLVIFILLV